MRFITKGIGGVIAVTTALALAGCGDGESEPDIGNTVVTDVDPITGSVDDTTILDATLGVEERANIEDAMPADSAEPRLPPAMGGGTAARTGDEGSENEPDANDDDAAEPEATTAPEEAE